MAHVDRLVDHGDVSDLLLPRVLDAGPALDEHTLHSEAQGGQGLQGRLHNTCHNSVGIRMKLHCAVNRPWA